MRRVVWISVGLAIAVGVGLVVVAAMADERADLEVPSPPAPVSTTTGPTIPAPTEPRASSRTHTVPRRNAAPAVPEAAPPPETPANAARHETASDAWTVEGVCRTVAEDGKPSRPVAHAVVEVWCDEPTVRRIAHVTADAQGRYVASLDALKRMFPTARIALDLFVRAEKDSLMTAAPSTVEESLPFDAERPFRATLPLELRHSARVTGRLVDTSGRPVVNATMCFIADPDDVIRGLAWEQPVRLVEGYFRERYPDGLLRPMPYHSVFFHANGVGISSTLSIEQKPGAHTSLGDVVLRPAGTIAGVATYADGSPARLLDLSITSPNQGGSVFPVASVGYEEHVRTDRAGRFRAVALRPEEYVLKSDERDYPELAVTLGVEDVRYPVPGRRILLRVRDDRGRGAVGAVVHVMRWTGSAARTARARVARGASLNDLRSAAVQYDDMRVWSADGRKSLPVRAGEFCVLNFEHVGMEPVTRYFDIDPTTWETDVDVILRPARAKGRLTFMFADDTAPVPDSLSVCVASALTQNDIGGASSWREPEMLPPLTPGRYHVAMAPASTADCEFLMVERTIDIQPGDNIVRVPLRRAGKLSVKVRLAAHIDPEEALGSLRVLVESIATGRTDATFAGFTVGPVRARSRELAANHATLSVGAYRLSLRGDGIRPMTQSVDITAGGHRRVVFDVR